MATRYFLGFFLAALLAGCGGGGSASTSGNPTSATPAATSAQNTTPPTISGTAPATAVVGNAYSFTPATSDAEGGALSFTIKNMPVWGRFNAATGELTGTPTAAEVGSYPGIVITVSDGIASADLTAFTITVTATPGASATAPGISGSPLTSVLVGAGYAFTPSATNPGGSPLTFSIENKPSWAAFNTSTGELSGTATAGDVGSTPGIIISVSDGTETASLPAFAIAVVQATNSTATLSWTPPTQNTDGTPLVNLAGYRIYYGTSASNLTTVIQISNPGIATHVVTNLTPATWYFSVKAYTASNTESSFSATVSKTIL
jgi:hypothetical protein